MAFPSSAGSARSELRSSSSSNRMYANSDTMAMTHAVCLLYARF